VLLESKHWQVVRPVHPLTEAHLALSLSDGAHIGRAGVAADLLEVYRTVRAGLTVGLGCDGFGLSFAWSWVPYGKGIGEPSGESGLRLIHVFGRYPDERIKPVRAMAQPVRERTAPLLPAEQDELDQRLTASLAKADPVPPVGLDVDPIACDGCIPEVEREQELWRTDGVRVIRPRQPLVDANVLVMPLRHVTSPASLSPHEVASYVERLREVRADFAQRFGSTGLSCFLNDGTRAGQETPHVHLHVFGRAVNEPQNPFEVLARRIGLLPAT
jgi:diadenosine tetraphosphate (Ap4A) HIT family hydrolase